MGNSVEIEIGEIEIGGRRFKVSGCISATGIPDRTLSEDELRALCELSRTEYPKVLKRDAIKPTILSEVTPDEPDGTSEPTKVETWHDRPSLL